jgi:hypothetical protein
MSSNALRFIGSHPAKANARADAGAKIRRFNFASGLTSQSDNSGGASEQGSRAVNSPPLATLSGEEQAARCAVCHELTDGDCGDFRCPFTTAAACARNGHGLRTVTPGVREPRHSRREGDSPDGC